MYELQLYLKFSFIRMLLQVDYNEQEEQFFRCIINAVENNLSNEQNQSEVSIDIDFDTEEKNVGAKHREYSLCTICTSRRGALIYY